MGLRVRVGDGLADGTGEAAPGLAAPDTGARAVLPATGAAAPVTGAGACDVADTLGALAPEVRVAAGPAGAGGCPVPDPVGVAALVCEAAGLVAVWVDRIGAAAGDAWPSGRLAVPALAVGVA